MQLSFTPYYLKLKHLFRVAAGARTTTPIVLTRIEHNGLVGYGEASMPPYLGESIETVVAFLKRVNLAQFSNPLEIDDILDYVDSIDTGNNAAKASVDIALHDLHAKLLSQPLHRLWHLDKGCSPVTSFTIGIDTPEIVRQKVAEAAAFPILKLKLGNTIDKQLVEAVRSATAKPLYVDVNQGWTDRAMALDMAYWLKENGVVLLEQPMPKVQIDDIAWLTAHSPLPIFADEGIRRLDELEQFHGAYSGVNIKLMKSTGLREARKMAIEAKTFGMQTMMGCMTETSCAISAAAVVSLTTDYADLDGALLITNDIFNGVTFNQGRVCLTNSEGIGVTPKEMPLPV